MGKNTDLELKNPGIPTPVSDSLTELLGREPEECSWRRWKRKCRSSSPVTQR